MCKSSLLAACLSTGTHPGGQRHARLDGQYTALRLHLRMSLDQIRPRDGLVIVRELEHSLAHRTAPAYRRWLAQLDQNLERLVDELEEDGK